MLPTLKELFRNDTSTHPLFKGLFAIGGVTSGVIGVIMNSLVMGLRLTPAMPSETSPYGFLLHVPHWAVWAMCCTIVFYNETLLALICALVTLQLVMDVLALVLVVYYSYLDVTLVVSFATGYGIVVSAVFIVLSVITNICAWRLLGLVMPLTSPMKWKKI